MSAILDVKGLVKRFGGLTATDHVSFDVHHGEVHAIIGPNGAGKTTLISQLAGELRPDEGQISFEGRDISDATVPQRALGGLGRSYQISQIFREFTALENVMLAVQAHAGHSFSFMKQMVQDAELRVPAMEALKQTGLEPRAHALASSMAHGEHRQLELAMTLACRPRLLLLDEPMAGTGPEESARMVELIERVRTKATVLLVEHDVDAVFRLADRVSVLVNGRVIASGEPEAVRHDPEVISAYLGDEAME